MTTRPPVGDRPGDDQHPGRRLRRPAPAGRPGPGRGPADLPRSRAGSSTTRRPWSARSARWSRQALAEAGLGADRIAAIGLTNQRETTVVWDRATGRAIGPALVWQDRRTADFCERHRDRRAWIAERTGLVLDPYFSATKIAWLLDHVPGARRRAEAGELAAGTVDSLLIWHLTGGRRHVTDATNASRTLLMDLRTLRWADDLCDFFGVPAAILPEILPSSGEFGRTLGPRLPARRPADRRAWRATSRRRSSARGASRPARPSVPTAPGRSCWPTPATTVVPSTRGLVTTLAATLGDGPPQYALEGSVFVAGAAVQWFRDGLKAVGAAPEIDRLCLDADPDSGVLFVPALTGLGAPHWEPEARGHDLRPDPRHHASPTSPAPPSKGSPSRSPT